MMSALLPKLIYISKYDFSSKYRTPISRNLGIFNKTKIFKYKRKEMPIREKKNFETEL